MLRSDRGGEFYSDDFKEFCQEHGIRRQLTASCSAQQNGVAERKNRKPENELEDAGNDLLFSFSIIESLRNVLKAPLK